jgi:hypothetical protein
VPSCTSRIASSFGYVEQDAGGQGDRPPAVLSDEPDQHLVEPLRVIGEKLARITQPAVFF